MAKTEDTGAMSTQDTLLAYSEWLDSQHLIVSDGMGKPLSTYGANNVSTPPDTRTHEDLASEFIADWESNPDRATLAGRVGAKFVTMLSKALHDAANSLSQ